jgi:hypothetical protein
MTKSAKPAIDPVRWTPPPSRPLPPPNLIGPLEIIPLPGNAPEDVVVDADGALWTGLDDGRIVRVQPGTEPKVVANTGGRPLGLEVDRAGRLLICDSHRGLLRLDPATGQFETLVSEVAGRPLMFCSNVVESSDGTIYFTESTSRFRYEHYKAAVLEARGNGSLFRRSTDGTVTTLVTGLHFANGVALTADESAIIVAETTGRRLLRYPLTPDGVGRPEPLLANLPGYPDNISRAPDGRIWVAMISPINPLSEWLAPRAPALRRLMWKAPLHWLPNPASQVWALSVDAEDGRVLSQLRTVDTRFALATGLVENAGRLWLGCIGAPALACLNLSQ